MTDTFDKTRCIELFKKEKALNNQKKSLFDENRAEYLELVSYGIVLESQIYYNRKAEYLCLIEGYKTGTIDAVLFRLAFLKMYREDNKAVKILKKDFQRFSTFLIDSKSYEFSPLINQIFDDCDALTFDFDPEDEESYRITKDQFRDSIETIFFQMQKFFDE